MQKMIRLAKIVFTISSNYYIIRVTLNTKSDTVWLSPMDSKLAGSNAKNATFLKSWGPWGGLFPVSSKSPCSCGVAI